MVMPAPASMVDHGRTWSTMLDHGRPWSTRVDNGRPWSTMVDHGRPWFFFFTEHARWSSVVGSSSRLLAVGSFQKIRGCIWMVSSFSQKLVCMMFIEASWPLTKHLLSMNMFVTVSRRRMRCLSKTPKTNYSDSKQDMVDPAASQETGNPI